LLDLFIGKHYVGNQPSEAFEKEKEKVNICAGGILCRGNKILLGKRSAHRSFYPHVWDIIGGHAVSNETPEQTLARELKEELDVIATEWKLLAVLPDQEPGFNEQNICYVYVVTGWIGSPRNALLDEHDALGWFEISEALQLDIALSGYAEVFRRLTEEIQARYNERKG
jgi:8-oxo-dGTP diphosphatase